MQEFFKFNLSLDQAQALSLMCAGLFAITFALLLIGTLTRLSKRSIHWLALTAFSACIAMGMLSSLLYFWHHYWRK